MIDADLRQAAEEFAKSPLAKHLFEKLQAQYFEDWKVSQSTEVREHCWRKHVALLDLQSEINTILVRKPGMR